MLSKMNSLVVFGMVLGVTAVCHANAPMPPSVFDMIRTGDRTAGFAEVFRMSGLTSADFGQGTTTFLVARDSRCTPEQHSRMTHLSHVEEARSYVLNHAVKGDLTILKSGNKVTLASYFPMGQVGARQIVDASHPVTIKTIGGDEIVLSLANGALHLGDAVALEGMTYGGADGSIIELDRCGDVTSAQR
ncbi:hypothetical protein IM816_10520 [Luteibacter flocculans]|uniref:FAS1 domain-containing protein n=1 Tax=Luteibacter flocculans TaxID=2780091 RepID=A0ABY4T2R4_9GAMM|nr:hypothetical protein [Luteibacter flocculans]URL57091.1 hypothetical protein IM816_10520 [Luteibacter flocculans]